MPERNTTVSPRRIAVIDVGSNSLRLVVFERLGGTLLPLLNEKVMCGLGRGIAASGRLNPEGKALALPNLERFVGLARALDADHLAVIATSAVRDAGDGADFAAEVERRCAVPVRIIDGGEEGRLSAAGVLAGIPGAEGVVGDLGGGSVELVPLATADVFAPEVDPIGPGVSLPLGPLRLAEYCDNMRAIGEAIDRAAAGAGVLQHANGKALFLVGGAWRAIARLHMEQSRYPLHIIHEYTLSRRSAEAFLDLVIPLSRRSLERITTIARKRLEVVPLAALILRKLIAIGKPDSVVFSAFGLREGYAYGLMSAQQRGDDPLIAACQALGCSQSPLPIDGDRLQKWTAPLFPGLSAARRRLHSAVCWLSDIGWVEHPDYRARHVFERSLRLPIAGLGHKDRVFVATALHARYGGAAEDRIKDPTRSLLDDRAGEEARSLGLALRLAYTLCGGATALLTQVPLRLQGDGVVLQASPGDHRFGGEAVQRRLDAVGRSLGLETRAGRPRNGRPIPA
ncbi:MAG: Ppx/GppA family phosphatase [Alphaproteobacteria bacterium]|nr:Ppx/GppA family phosphatase [Alphaproteobacteria bacterium]